MFEKDQPDKETIMGERGKYGIYQTGNLDSLNVIKEDYHSLIKKYNPKYNILLKDDKSYPYIEFTNEVYPRLRIIRNTKRKKNKNLKKLKK